MPLLVTNCQWKAVIYNVLWSAAASLLTINIKGTTVQIFQNLWLEDG
jgi:hypothetical protein